MGSRDWSDYQDTKVLLDIVAQVEPWSEGNEGNGPKELAVTVHGCIIDNIGEYEALRN